MPLSPEGIKLVSWIIGSFVLFLVGTMVLTAIGQAIIEKIEEKHG